MKTAVLYNLVERPTSKKNPLPKNWPEIIKRFKNSYLEFKSGFDHDLIICTSGSEMTEGSKEIFRNIRYQTFAYYGRGWDVGAYQYAATKLKGYQKVLFLNSEAHVCSDDWLGKFSAAWEQHGSGVYGSSSSFEIAPHIRTCAMMTSPTLVLKYPYRIRSRYDAGLFENSPKNFSLWAAFSGIPVYVVLKNSSPSLFRSRCQAGVFRSEEQQELIIQDRHSLLFKSASQEQKLESSRRASGESRRCFEYVSSWKRPLLPLYESLFC
jgi:hypothetical protein